MTVSLPSARPKHLKATYLAQGAPLTIRFSALPPVPGLTWAFGGFPTFGQYAPANYLSFLFVIFTILAVLWFAYRYARWISTVYAVTTSRDIVQRGILARDFDQIPILHVRGVDVHQTIVDRILGFGTVVISSEGGNRDTRLG